MEQLGYAYDMAWNLNQRTNGALVQVFNVNTLNELTSVTNSGYMMVAGTTTSPATNVTVNTSNAVLYADSTFASPNQTWVSGNNTYTAVAHDVHGRSSTSSVTATLPSMDYYSYDLNGNLLAEWSQVGGTNRQFTYNVENQLLSVWVTNSWSNSFAYDGSMRKRIERDYAWNGGAWTETNEIHFIYDGNLVFQERDGNNLPLTTYTRGNDLSGSLQGAGGIGGLLARSDKPQVTPQILSPVNPRPQNVLSSFYHSDGSGNVTALVEPNGFPVAAYEYDPFGNVLLMSGLMAGVNHYRFSSKEWNNNAGIYYYGYRFYDPNLLRWPNRDPMGEFGGLNLYGYVYNDPLGMLDPYGLALFGLYDSYGDYFNDVWNTFEGEAKGAGANLSFGLYSPCYLNSLQKQGGYVGQGLAMAGETLAGGAGLLNGAGRAGLGQLGKQGLSDFAKQKFEEMVGKKALSDAKYAKYFDKDPAQMGRNILKGEGKIRGTLPDPTGNLRKAVPQGLTPGAEMLAGSLGLGAAAKNALDLSNGGNGGCQ